MKIVLDPSMIWIDPYIAEDFQYFSSVVELIDRYFDLEYFVSNRFIELLYRMLKDPMEGYRESQQIKTDIVSKLWRGIRMQSILDLEEYSPSTLPDGFQFPERPDLKQYLLQVFGYVERENTEMLMFLSRRNHSWSSPSYYSIKFVKHIYTELDSNLGVLFSDGNGLKEGCLIKPTYSNPLPNADLCKGYSQLRIELIQAGKGDISNFRKLGREVAFRNGYSANSYLSRINDNAIRDIYDIKARKTIYLSTDVEHGAFEVFDESGQHLGEFSYEGEKTSEESRDHCIKLNR